MDNIVIVKSRLQLAKKRLQDLWNDRKKTDRDVLAAGEEVDRLINLYNRLLKE